MSFSNYREITNSEQKELMLNILNEFHQFCDINGLRYSLSYGTALGAVRHGGFIPWDDDIDVMMPRKDYEILKKTFRSSKLKFYTQQTHQPYAYTFGKLVNTDTILIEHKVQNKYKLGVHVDIFPMDYFPIEKEKEIHQVTLKQEDILRFSILKIALGKNIVRSLGKFIKIIYTRAYCKIHRLKPYNIVNDLENRMKEYGSQGINKYMKVFFGGSLKELKFTEDDFNALISIEFESHYFNIVKNYNDYLKSIYGDYMKLPPINERISNHDFSIYWRE